MPWVGLYILFSRADSSLAAFAQGVFGQFQGFAGAQQTVVDLLAQLISLITGQGRGMFQQPFRVADQRLEVGHQDFLSSLCLGAGHG
ncbi:hypothetical protein D3C76_1703860 [compost metagenome]